MGKKIIVLGSINNDLIIETDKLPILGETLLGHGFMTAAGGKGANQAVAIARLGGEPVFIGAVGDDLFGGQLKENLQNNGVDVQNVVVQKNCPTGTAVIVLHEGDNFIIIDKGANDKVSIEMVKAAEPIIKEAGILVLQHEIPLETVAYAIELASQHGVKILLNPAPAYPVEDRIFKLIDILTPNESECAAITGIQVDSPDDAEKAARFLLDKGVRQVVITMGENGCVYNDGDAIKHMPPFPAYCVMDTTAAGDSFTGALAVSLSEGKSIGEAIRFATVVGSITVSKKGAQPSLPYREQVDEKMNLSIG